VGLRRGRRVRLHRGPDARHRAPPDAGPGDGRAMACGPGWTASCR
jgi:hypothetical protein